MLSEQNIYYHNASTTIYEEGKSGLVYFKEDGSLNKFTFQNYIDIEC